MMRDKRQDIRAGGFLRLVKNTKHAGNTNVVLDDIGINVNGLNRIWWKILGVHVAKSHGTFLDLNANGTPFRKRVSVWRRDIATDINEMDRPLVLVEVKQGNRVVSSSPPAKPSNVIDLSRYNVTVLDGPSAPGRPPRRIRLTPKSKPTNKRSSTLPPIK
jgi:hypothetical protein